MPADFVTSAFILALSGAVVWGLWRAAQPKAIFTIRIVDGVPQASSGTVTPAFLLRVREVAEAHAISTGALNGFAHGQKIRLRFSQEFSPTACQQLRNWWATFGWSAPKICGT